MAPNRGRNRATEFDDLIESAPQEFDPEADDIVDEDSEGSELEDGDAAREHYEAVGNSKLRKPKDVPLGPQYRGSRVDREEALDDGDEDDPFSKGFEDDESEDEDDVLDGAEDASEESDDDTPDTDVSDEDEQSAQADKTVSGPSRQDEIKLAMRDTRNVASALSQASQADADKGRAVKQQRTAFDSLLGTRMKLQKALIGANTISSIAEDDLRSQREDAAGAIQAAETAAFNLWSSLNSLRDELIAARTGEKRKRAQYSVDTPISDLLSHMRAQEADSLERRNATLQKWSKKTQERSGGPQRTSLLNGNAPQTTVLDVVQQHLSDTPRLLKRAHTPRSCAPVQVARKVAEDDKIYDDADFYGLMLKELLEAKSADSISASNINIDLSFQMRREAKTKKNVDTKASKGRKLRYTVHEKIENFMAPEDRRQWGERQADELFSSLFGERMGLREDAVDDEEEAVHDAMGEEEAGLMMFRS